MFRQTPRQIPECATLTIDREGLIRPMARKLRIYQTSLGFFDLAMAAPSMKAALEAWGADSNLFHQGAAKESHDPDIIAATMAKPGVVLSARLEPTDLSANMPSCPPILAPADQGKPPASRKAQRRRSLPLAPSTRPRNGRPLSPTNGNGRAASSNGRRKRQPGRRTVNAVSRRSRRRRLRWTRPSGSTRSRPPPSRPRLRLLRRGRKPKKSGGIRRRSDWKPRCGARGVSLCRGTPRVKANGQAFIVRDLGRVLRLGSPRRGPVASQERAP